MICDFSRNQWSWEWMDKNIVGVRLSVCKSPYCFFVFFVVVVFVLNQLIFTVCTESPPRSWWCSFAAGTRAQDVDLLFQEADFSNLIKNNTNCQNTHTLMRGRGQLRTCQSGKSVQERRSARTKNCFTSRSFRGESYDESWKTVLAKHHQENSLWPTSASEPDLNLGFYIGLAAELMMKTWHHWGSTK